MLIGSYDFILAELWTRSAATQYKGCDLGVVVCRAQHLDSRNLRWPETWFYQFPSLANLGGMVLPECTGQGRASFINEPHNNWRSARVARASLYIGALLCGAIGFPAVTVAADTTDAVPTLRIDVSFDAEPGVNSAHVVVALLSNTPIRGMQQSKKIIQSNAQFHPFITVAQPGAEIEFPNQDAFAHHVYSFSPSNSFELPLYNGRQRQTQIMANVGIVSLGCNIHDWMLGYVVVIDTPYSGFLTGRTAEFHDVAEGDYEVMIWHPSMDEMWSQAVSINSTTQQLTISLPITLSPVAPLPTPNFTDDWEDY